jgi:hypothetical protein
MVLKIVNEKRNLKGEEKEKVIFLFPNQKILSIFSQTHALNFILFFFKFHVIFSNEKIRFSQYSILFYFKVVSLVFLKERN